MTEKPSEQREGRTAERFEQAEALGCKWWHQVYPHPGEIYPPEETGELLDEKQARVVWTVMGLALADFALSERRKAVEEVFLILKNDPRSLQYPSWQLAEEIVRKSMEVT